MSFFSENQVTKMKTNMSDKVKAVAQDKLLEDVSRNLYLPIITELYKGNPLPSSYVTGIFQQICPDERQEQIGPSSYRIILNQKSEILHSSKKYYSYFRFDGITDNTTIAKRIKRVEYSIKSMCGLLLGHYIDFTHETRQNRVAREQLFDTVSAETIIIEDIMSLANNSQKIINILSDLLKKHVYVFVNDLGYNSAENYDDLIRQAINCSLIESRKREQEKMMDYEE